MKHFIIIFLFLFTLVSASYAQQGYTYAGSVIGEDGYELIGVSVSLKNSAGIGVITDLDGKFRLTGIPTNAIIVFSYVGYISQEVKVTESKERQTIVLKQDLNELDEVVVIGRGTQRKVSVVGAITSINASELQVPSSSVSNMLQGRVPGIIGVTRSGEPGNDFSEFWVRGISTFGANAGALILVDGVEGDLNTLDPADIESFSILKDASATAVYGVRGANGVVVVTTKKGIAGKLNVNFKSNVTYSYSPRMPKYTNATQYASLANEARMARGYDAVYSAAEIELFRSGLDPDLYPNVNWSDVILKDYVLHNQHHLSVSGGGSNARYYVSVGIMNQDAVFKIDKSAGQRNTNVGYDKYNFRANIDTNLTKSTVFSLNMETVIVQQSAPGYGNDNNALWTAQANLPATMVPVKYSDNTLPAYGSNGNQISPYVQLNYTGDKIYENQSTTMNAKVSQELDFITKGLSIGGLFSFNYTGYYNQSRNKIPDLYYATGRKSNGDLIKTRTIHEQDVFFSDYKQVYRQYYFEGTVNYSRMFNDIHRVTGLLHAYRQEKKDSKLDYWNDDMSLDERFRSIPKRYQAISARATYSYADTYMFEFNVGYTGSENFKAGHRFGWFPAVALGWVPTQYDWVKENLSFVNYFKLRASVGKVGNDRINYVRFPYLSTVSTGYNSTTWNGITITENRVGAEDLNWEETTKYDIGIDGRLFNDKIDFTIDLFKDTNKGIFQQRANIPDEAGFVSAPYTNIGGMKSWGIDGNIAYTHTLGNESSMTVRGNLTYAKNKVTYWEQSGVIYPYQSYSGVPYGVQRGLISLGLFSDQNDIDSSPKQTFSSDVRPGDIKYKDVNGDGQIDNDDIVPMSYSNTPQLQYGLAAEFRWKKFTASVFFEGAGKVQYFFGGTGYYPFSGGSTGNVLSIVSDQNNRWTPREISGDPSTENPNARFPRLSYGDNANNNRASTFWLVNGDYIRLKNVELSYRWENNWVKKRIGLSSATFSVIGDNLHVWDKVKLWDPGQASDNGAVYPLQRKITFQVYLTF